MATPLEQVELRDSETSSQGQVTKLLGVSNFVLLCLLKKNGKIQTKQNTSLHLNCRSQSTSINYASIL